MAAKAKWLKRTLIAMVALLMLGVTAIVTLLDSEAGTRWVFDQIDRRLPGELQIDRFSGTLWTGLQIPVLTYRDANRDISASDLAMAIDWSRVSPARLVLSSLSSGTVVYRDLADEPQEPKPLQLGLPPMPLIIGAASIGVGEFQFVSASSDTSIRDIDIVDLLVRGVRVSAMSAAASSDAGSLVVSALSAKLDGDVPVSATIEWNDTAGGWSGRGPVSGSLAILQFDHNVIGPYPATASGTVQLLRRTEPLIDATVEWREWRFGNYRSESGRVRVNGYLPGYEANFDLQLSDQNGHAIRLNGTASGDTNGLSAFRTKVDSAIGQLDAEGSLNWLPTLTSVLRVSGRGLDLSKIIAVPQTDIGIDLTIDMENQSAVLFTVHSIDGTYNDQRFLARGKLARTDQAWRCDRCDVDIGANRGSIQGRLSANVLALTASIDAPQLYQLWPGLGGAVALDGTLLGTLTAPVFTGQASGSSLSWSGWQVDRFTISSRKSTLQHLELKALVEELRQHDRQLGSFDISLNGDLAQLDSRIRWELADFSADAAGQIDLTSDYAQGSVHSAQFNHTNTGRWDLTNSFRFSTGQDAVNVAAHQWTNDDAILAVNELRIAGDETWIDAKLDRLPLALLQPAMPENVKIDGHANAGVRLRRNKVEWFGSFNWNQHQTQMHITQLDEEPIDIEIPVAEVDVRLLGNSAEATAVLGIDPGVSATLRVSLAALRGNPDIEATLSITGNDWYWMPAVFPEIDQFEGVIAAEMSAHGPLQDPNFSGELHWRNGRLIIPAFNVPISDIDIVVSGSSSGDAMTSGQFRAGGGMLSIDGRFDDLMRTSRSFTVRISGENAELLNWAEYKVTASPDIRIAGGQDGVSVNGRVEIPRAEIAIRQIPEGSVKPSGDVTVIGRTNQEESTVPVTGQAEFILGKDVHINALGLDTKLRGQLTLTVPENRQLRAEGKLTLVDGVFEAYGQRLTITEGSMLFTGPLDNPFVSVRAVRTIESLDSTVMAGIDLHGPAQNLVASVFSEPTMAESDALSYLVLGRPLEQSTATEGSQLSGAAVALGLRQAGKITNQIGQAFGLDQLEVTGDGSSTTALVAGKQVSSRLYVRYAYGVFSQLGAILLRYRLSQRLTLETTTGESHSMDLLYILEKP